MNQESLNLIVQVIRESNNKILAETEEKGIKKGREETKLEIAQKLKGIMDNNKIALITNLPIEKIQNL